MGRDYTKAHEIKTKQLRPQAMGKAEEEGDAVTVGQIAESYNAYWRDIKSIVSKAGIYSEESDGVMRQDAVNHPQHYKHGRFETIEVIEDITQHYEDGYVAYCVGNTLKYLARAPHKHDGMATDIEKAAKYLEFALEHLKGGD